MEKTRIENDSTISNLFPGYLKSEEKERIDRALFNVILNHPELMEEESTKNERLEIFDRYVGKGGFQRSIEDQVRWRVKAGHSKKKIMEYIMSHANEHRPGLIQDDLRHLKELYDLGWNLFNLEFDENRPRNLGASFSLSFSGIYAVYEDSQIIYIGTAANLRQRFIQHLFPAIEPLRTPLYEYLKGRFSGIKIKVKKMDKKFRRLTLEARLIHRIKPIVNTHYRIRES